VAPPSGVEVVGRHPTLVRRHSTPDAGEARAENPRRAVFLAIEVRAVATQPYGVHDF